MNVMNYLWMPNIVDLVYSELRLYLRECVPIAVVIVTGIFVIELRRVSSFVRSAECLVVPVLDDIDAIGIKRRDQKNNCVVEYFLNCRIIRRCQLICDEHTG